MAETAALLADEVLPERPLRQWVLSMPMALRFLLATRPAVLSEVLGVVYRTISGHLLARAGVRRVAGYTGAVTLIQRFGSALNLNVHFHMIFVDGVYVTDGRGAPVFRAVRSPGAGELQALVQQMAERIGRLLEKRGLIERDAESAWLSGEPVQAGSLDELIGHCITWRIAVGPRAGQKVFTLQTVAAHDEGEGRSGAAQAGGFSLHAGVSIKPGQRSSGGPVPIQVGKVADLHVTVGEARDHLKLAAHRLDVAAQGGDVHVRASFNLRDGGLLNVEHFRQHLLRQATSLAQLAQRHFREHRSRLRLRARLRLGCHLRP
jgi:hypothetical protein